MILKYSIEICWSMRQYQDGWGWMDGRARLRNKSLGHSFSLCLALENSLAKELLACIFENYSCRSTPYGMFEVEKFIQRRPDIRPLPTKVFFGLRRSPRYLWKRDLWRIDTPLRFVAATGWSIVWDLSFLELAVSTAAHMMDGAFQ